MVTTKTGYAQQKVNTASSYAENVAFRLTNLIHELHWSKDNLDILKLEKISRTLLSIKEELDYSISLFAQYGDLLAWIPDRDMKEAERWKRNKEE